MVEEKAGGLPERTALAAQHRRIAPPPNEVPVALPWVGMLGRSEDAAIFLLGAHLYSTGVRFEIAVRARGDAAYGLHGAALGRPDGDQLLLGVESSDGTRAANFTPAAVDSASGVDSAKLTAAGGGGGYGAVDTAYFLCPAPSPGRVSVLCAWPSRGIPETQSEFDDREVLADQVVELWPLENDGFLSPPPRAPIVPAGGWFEAYATASD